MDRLLLFCIALAVTPATVLLFFVLTIGLGIEKTFVEFGKISDWVSTIISSVTAIIAIFAYQSWSRSLAASWDREVKIHIEPEIYKIIFHSNKIMTNHNIISRAIIELKNKAPTATLPPPPPYPDHDSINVLLNSSLETKFKFHSASETLIELASDLDRLNRNFVKDIDQTIREIETFNQISNTERVISSLPEFDINNKIKIYEKINETSFKILNHSPINRRI